MNKFLKILNLKYRQKILAIKVFFVLIYIKLGLKFFNFEKFKKKYNSFLINSYNFNTTEVVYFIKAISNNFKFLGFTCLPQALALKYFFAANEDIKVVIGVSKVNANFEAHAWVEQNNEILIGNFLEINFKPIWIWQ